MAFMHICGYSGSGKTSLGNLIREKYRDFVAVKDLDDFLLNNVSMELRVKEYIERMPNKIIIFIGTTCNNPTPQEFVNIPAKHHVWLDTSLEESCTRALIRQFDWSAENKIELIEMFKNMTIDETREHLNTFYNYQARIVHWQPLFDICMGKNYRVFTSSQIIELIDVECRL